MDEALSYYGPGPGRKRPRSDSKTTENGNLQPSNADRSFMIDWLTTPSIGLDGEESPVQLEAIVSFPKLSVESASQLCLMGRAQIKCTKGSITILGYRLDPSHGAVSVESPPWSSLLVLEPNHEESIKDNNGDVEDNDVVIQVESWWPQKEPSGEESHHFEATFEFADSHAQGLRPTYIPSTWENAANQILPSLHFDNKGNDQIQSDEKGSSNLLNGSIDISNKEPSSLEGELQPKINTHKDNTKKDGFRMAICGAKGVGKSTFLRYVTNRILSDPCLPTQQVAILDADVGQPEMSPPGLVTLTILSEPLLTPPHYRSLAAAATNPSLTSTPSSGNDQQQLQQPKQFAYFFGSVTSRNDPERYLSLIQRLLEHYEQDVVVGKNGNNKNKIPLLINLDGWVRGLGYELLSTLLTEVLDPLSHVVQIVGTTKSKQFELRGDVLNPETSAARLHVIHAYNSSLNVVVPNNCSSKDGNGESTGSNNGIHNVASNSNSEEALAATAPKTKIPSACVMPAQALRALRLCTYFLNDVTIWYNLGFNHEGIGDDTCEIAHRLAGAMPYAVPFEAVTIQWAGSDHFSDIAASFNGTAGPQAFQQDQVNDLMVDAINAKVVGLCCRPPPGDSSDNDDSGSDERLSCAGLGFVRAVDRVRRIFYILTPADSSRLKDVNVLVGCNLDVPVEFWYRGVQAESFPYQSYASASTNVGADPIKSRNTLGRKGLQNSK